MLLLPTMLMRKMKIMPAIQESAAATGGGGAAAARSS